MRIFLCRPYHKDRQSTAFDEEPLSNLDRSDLLAQSIFHVENGYLKHSLLLDGMRVPELELLTKSISTNDVHFVANWMHSRGEKVGGYYFVITPNEPDKIKPSTPDELGVKMLADFYAKPSTLRGPDLEWIVANGSVRCNEPCPDDGKECEVYGDGTEFCEAYTCGNHYLPQNSSVSSAFSQTYLDAHFDDVLYRSFRDGFMESTTTGQKYVAYYYSLGNFLESTGTWNAQTMILTASKMPSILALVNNVESGIGSTVIVTPTIETDMNTLIDAYYDVSENVDYRAILDDIRDDIDLYAGKTLEEIMIAIDK